MLPPSAQYTDHLSIFLTDRVTFILYKHNVVISIILLSYQLINIIVFDDFHNPIDNIVLVKSYPVK